MVQQTFIEYIKAATRFGHKSVDVSPLFKFVFLHASHGKSNAIVKWKRNKIPMVNIRQGIVYDNLQLVRLAPP